MSGARLKLIVLQLGVLSVIGGVTTFLYTIYNERNSEITFSTDERMQNWGAFASSIFRRSNATQETASVDASTETPLLLNSENFVVTNQLAITSTNGTPEYKKLSSGVSYVTGVIGLGRLGNHMFMYAGVFAAALRHNLTAAFFVSDSTPDAYLTLKSIFQLTTEPYGDLYIVDKTIMEQGFGIYEAAVENRENFGRMTLVKEYLQSFKYFQGCESAIRSEFTLTERYAHLAEDFLRRLAAGRKDLTFVGVHIRRGDMVSNPNYMPAPITYIVKAMEYFSYKYGNQSTLQFVVASDDLEWWATTIAAVAANRSDINVAYTGNSPAGDMAILTRCNHSVITLGSYGWWAGWLAGGEVAYFRDFIPETSVMNSQYRVGDYYPPSWTGMT